MEIIPIADNDIPQLSSDRLGYTLSNGLGVRKAMWNLEEIKDIERCLNFETKKYAYFDFNF